MTDAPAITEDSVLAVIVGALDPLQGRAWGTELELQDAIHAQLDAVGVEHSRERRLDDAGEIDFLCTFGIGIEVKIGGSVTQLTRQVHRYMEHPDVRALLVVTTRAQHRRMSTEKLCGKPLYLCYLCPLGSS